MKGIIVLGLILSHPTTAQVEVDAVKVSRLATAKLLAANFREAEMLYRQALGIWERDGRVDVERALALGNLGTLHNARAEFAQAKSRFHEAIAMLDGLVPPDDIRTARLGLGLANAHAAAGQLSEAKRLAARALPICAGTPEDLATAASVMGRIAEAEGTLPRAERWFRLALTLRTEALGPHHPETARVRGNLGVIFRLRGRLAEAEEQYQQALADFRTVHGEEHPAVAMLTNNLGQVQFERGKWKEAQASYESAARILRTSLGDEHPNVANVLTNLAALYQARKKYGRAETLLVEALAIEQKHYPEGHPRLAMTVNNIAALAALRKRYDDAERLLLYALESLRAALPADHPDIGLVCVNLGEIYRVTRAYDRATPLYVEGLGLLEKAWGPDDPRLIPKLQRYSDLMRAQEEFAEAGMAEVRLVRIQVKQALR